MKPALLSFFTMILFTFAHAQSPVGSWEATITDEQGDPIRMVVIFSKNNYQVLSRYKAKTGEFIDTNGGRWYLDGTTMTEVVHFDSNNNERVGDSVSFEVQITATKLTTPDNNTVFRRIDNGTESPLSGAWFISGRERNGEMQPRDPASPRKTLKILSDSRFQWIAYNTETKAFMGTGGGTYTAENEKYREKIEFFSRDNSRAGAQLEFLYQLEDGHWHHSGKSSKGQPIHEIWSMEN